MRQIPKIKSKADKTLIQKYGSLMPMNDHKPTVDKIKSDSLKKTWN